MDTTVAKGYSIRFNRRKQLRFAAPRCCRDPAAGDGSQPEVPKRHRQIGMTSVKEETVLVTGASAGIGRELARLFAADGSRLVLVARRREQLEELARELKEQHGVESIVVTADLSDPAAPRAVFDELATKGVEIDVLVNNAGFGLVGDFAELGETEQVAMVQVNVASLVHLTRLFLPGMLARGRGGVLNVGSTAAFQPGPTMAIYYATKAFVLSFSEAIHEEVRKRGLSVTCLAPGPTATEFGDVSGMNDTLLFKLGLMSAKSVAQAGHKAFRRGRSLVVPGPINWLGAFSVRFVPRSISRKFAKALQRRGGKHG